MTITPIDYQAWMIEAWMPFTMKLKIAYSISAFKMELCITINK